MSAVTPIQTNYVDTACQTMSFDEIVEQQVQERIKKEERKDDFGQQMIDDLFPYCFEMPRASLDETTGEVFKEPFTLRCCHTFDRSTLLREIEKIDNDILKEKGFPCPKCNTDILPKYETFGSPSFLEVVNHLKKINEVFKNYVRTHSNSRWH